MKLGIDDWLLRRWMRLPLKQIQLWDKVIPVRARTATAEEKKRVWPIMTEQWPDYDTKRDIPWCCSRRVSSLTGVSAPSAASA
jgi:hypothetical protein